MDQDLSLTDTGNLKHDERLRLEALAQSVATGAAKMGGKELDTTLVVDRARIYERFIKGNV